jgi:CBS-domain-containing membrane protein
MTVANLVSKATPPLKPTDTVEYALGLLMQVRVRHLPVVDADRRVVGLFSEDQLLDAAGPDAELSTLVGQAPVTVSSQTHLFEVARILMEHDLTAVPVVDDDLYMGVVRRHELFEWFARSLATNASGAILALEVDARDYVLSQLVYAIEQSDVKVLSVSTEMPDGPDGRVCITVKLNVRDASRVKHILEHRGVRVVAAFGEEETDEDFLYRVQEFMRYLET